MSVVLLPLYLILKMPIYGYADETGYHGALGPFSIIAASFRGTLAELYLNEAFLYIILTLLYKPN